MENITFRDLNLKDNLINAIDDLGYTNPSQIQAEAIPLALEGHDIIGQAQTGTGKTAAFGCSILNNMERGESISSIILTPTRELAIQIYEEFRKLTKYSKLRTIPIYGGDSIMRQIKELNRGVDIVVGTPGRVQDLINRKALKLANVKYLVLDEADEMLNMGFIEDIEEIIKELPSQEERQTLLFSATMPPQIQRLAKNYLKKDYKIVNIKKVAMTVSKITQGYFEVNPKTKFEAFCRVLDLEAPNSSIIFCKTKKGVDDLVESLQSANYQAEGMHGDMSQMHRMRTLRRFKEGSLTFLVATDVAARGIDVDGVTHVFNYDLPQDVESYVHRIGRTGRANKEGTAYSLVTPREHSMIKQIMRVTKGEINRMSIPTVQEIINNMFKNKAKQITSAINDGDFGKYTVLASELCENNDPQDVIATLLKMQLDKEMSFDYKKNCIEAPHTATERGTRDSRGGRFSGNGDDVRLFFSIGKRDKLTVKALVQYITEKANINGKKVNKIDILESFSFVTVDKDVANIVVDKCTGSKINKRRINVEVATNRKR